MFDIKAIRENPDAFDAGWARRGLEPQTARILEKDTLIRKAKTRVNARVLRLRGGSIELAGAEL